MSSTRPPSVENKSSNLVGYFSDFSSLFESWNERSQSEAEHWGCIHQWQTAARSSEPKLLETFRDESFNGRVIFHVAAHDDTGAVEFPSHLQPKAGEFNLRGKTLLESHAAQPCKRLLAVKAKSFPFSKFRAVLRTIKIFSA